MKRRGFLGRILATLGLGASASGMVWDFDGKEHKLVPAPAPPCPMCGGGGVNVWKLSRRDGSVRPWTVAHTCTRCRGGIKLSESYGGKFDVCEKVNPDYVTWSRRYGHLIT